ncbi:alpha-glucuronidase [Protaetiibacter larvae]|uniref:Alpha-glucuronidase n=1 Tax=Protaetiibacter larvae TaxID=2592654 RepID=A0A5C1Y5C0_9MICO|nr:alpha-glucuronidase [Protaetiibacter larvae]QEO08961.1 alpha-glucuronidase [Protaetiibacter larvae]
MNATDAVHPMWLPAGATAHLAGRTVAVVGEAPLADTVRGEVRSAGAVSEGTPDVVLGTATALEAAGITAPSAPEAAESFAIGRRDGVTVVSARDAAGLLYGWFALVRLGAAALDDALVDTPHSPAHAVRMLDHWDNVDRHEVMGQIERGYAGDSIFFANGRVRDELSRVAEYARLLASIGVNRVAVNNVNVHRREARLLTDDLDELARIAAVFRPWGIRLHLSVTFASPILLGGLDTSDPLDARVASWWAEATHRVYATIPDFGGYLVKADSEGQPGPFAYGRTHADGANLLARALAPHGGMVHWRAFVYNHHQDWRDRRTDRARAAYDHFTPLDGLFDDNVVVQIKYGPMDFQTREPVSPLFSGLNRTRQALELQVTQEYTGHQLHAVYLGVQWAEILRFRPFGDAGPALGSLVRGGLAAVSNVGDDVFWTGHPLAQANLYAYGRLAWDPDADPLAILDEWIGLTFGTDETVRATIHEILDDSWRVYESYTAPLGVGFMVRPGSHYGPDVDGYEYTPWGTYHFADRDGIGVDRSVATGTGFAGQYPEPWRTAYERPETTPDELLLFFHHVPYGHRLHDGTTVIQHIYDTRFAGLAAVERKRDAWAAIAGRVPEAVFARVSERLDEQLRSAREWRDQLNSYFLRKSGVPDAKGRTIY